MRTEINKGYSHIETNQNKTYHLNSLFENFKEESIHLNYISSDI